MLRGAHGDLLGGRSGTHTPYWYNNIYPHPLCQAPSFFRQEFTQAPADPEVVSQASTSVARIGDASEYYSGTTDSCGSKPDDHGSFLGELRAPSDGGDPARS